MCPDEPTTKKSIRRTAMELLAVKSRQRITVREIAEKAEVNIASINYHFGSKDALLDEAALYYCMELNGVHEILEDESISPEQRLRQFCIRLMEYTFQYSGVEKSLMGQVMAEESINPKLVENISRNMASLKVGISNFTGTKDELHLNIKATQLVSCLIYPILMSGYGYAAMGMGLDQPGILDQYVDILIRSLE